MSKKRKSLWAWLMALAMVITMLNAGSRPVTAYAAEGEEAIPTALELDKSYSGTLSIGGYYTVSTSVAAGETFQIEMTIVSGAAIYKQAAIQSSLDNWSWPLDGSAIWANDGISNGTVVSRTIEAQADASYLTIKLHMDQQVDEAVTGTEAVVSGLKITKITADNPDAGDESSEYTEGTTLALNKAYSGTVTATDNGYKICAYAFNVSDPDIAVGDTYKVQMTIVDGAAAYKQVAVQTDADSYTGWNKVWLESGVVSGTVLSCEITVTQNMSGGFKVQLCIGNPVDESAEVAESVALTFKDFSVSIDRGTDEPTPTTSGSSSSGSDFVYNYTDPSDATPTPAPTSTPTPTPTAVPEKDDDKTDDGNQGTSTGGEKEPVKKITITRTVPGGTKEVTKTVESNQTLDANDENGKMYKIPMDPYDGSGDLKKILVTITFDQTTAQGWTGGDGSIGYSADTGWQQVDFEHAFVDGEKNTKTFEVEIPAGVNPTFDKASGSEEGSLVQVGWWWGSTSAVTVDKVEFVFEQPGEKEISITVNENAPVIAKEAGENVVSLTELVAQIARVDKIELRVAANGRFKGSVYALVAEGEIPLMAENKVKLGDIEIDDEEGGYKTFAFEGLAGTLTGDIIIEIEEIEEGAAVVVDSISLFGVDDEELTDSVADAEVPDDEDGDEAEDTPDEDADEDTSDDEDAGDNSEAAGDDADEDGEDADDASEPADAEEDLPKTGLADSMYFYILGLAIVAAGVVVAVKRRRELEA